MDTLHRSLRSLSVVLTINQPRRGCAAVDFIDNNRENTLVRKTAQAVAARAQKKDNRSGCLLERKTRLKLATLSLEG